MFSLHWMDRKVPCFRYRSFGFWHWSFCLSDAMVLSRHDCMPEAGCFDTRIAPNFVWESSQELKLVDLFKKISCKRYLFQNKMGISNNLKSWRRVVRMNHHQLSKHTPPHTFLQTAQSMRTYHQLGKAKSFSSGSWSQKFEPRCSCPTTWLEQSPKAWSQVGHQEQAPAAEASIVDRQGYLQAWSILNQKGSKFKILFSKWIKG